MKIAFVYDCIYPYTIGGAERRYWEIAKRLAQDHEIHLFGMKFWEGSRCFLKEGVYLHGVCSPMSIYTRAGRRSVMQAIYFALSLYRPFQNMQFDIIESAHFQYFANHAINFIRRNKKKSALIITWQATLGNFWNYYLGLLGGIGGKLDRSIASIADFHICVSKRTREMLISEFRISPHRTAIVPNGVCLTQANSQPATKEKMHLVYCGRLVPDKQIDLLIYAFAQIVPDFPKAKLLVIGEGPDEARLKKIADRFSLNHHIQWVGPLRSPFLEETIRKAAALVLPSRREGQPLVILEAMSLGTPVIAVKTEHNAIDEFIRDGKNGLVCESQEKGLAHSIRRLLQDESLQERITTEAKKEVENFDWDDKIIPSLLEIYNQVIKSK